MRAILPLSLALVLTACGDDDRVGTPPRDGGTAGPMDARIEDASGGDGSGGDDAPAPDAGGAGTDAGGSACDEDRDLAIAARCGGPDCCDRGDEASLGCSPVAAPTIYPGSPEDWSLESLPVAGVVSALEIDPSGVVHAALLTEEGAIHGARRDGAWTMETADTDHDRGPVGMEVASDGTVRMTYGDRGFTTAYSNLYYAVRATDGAWGVEPATSDGNSGHGADLALDASGHAYIAHMSLIGHRIGASTLWTGYHVYYTTNATGSWQTQMIGSGGGASIAWGSDGTLRVVWHDFWSLMQSVMIVRVDSAGATRLERVALAPMYEASTNGLTTAIAIDPAGGEHVVFVTLSETSSYVLSYARSTSSGWTVETIAEVREAVVVPRGDIALAPDGTPHVCFVGEPVLRHAVRDAGSGRFVVSDVQSLASQGGCDIEIEPDGTVHIGFGNVRDSPGNPGDGSFAARHAWTAPSAGIDRDCDGVD